ncbi:MAG: Gram-negative bacterial tonB protein [bacterium ADurb.Bin478]|nr:MAG: Gram-negative bacterial tonB protein [bacterium ADurb.Bin478]
MERAAFSICPDQDGGRALPKNTALCNYRQKTMKKFFSLLLIAAACCFLFCASGPKRLKPPKVQSGTKLDYPISAQLEHLEGEVELGIFVSQTGVPEEVKLLKGSGHAVLDEAALAFGRKISFDPALVDGQPISAWTRLVLRYRLTDVAFERVQWLREVLDYQKQAAEETDTVRFEQHCRRVYTSFSGMQNWAQTQSVYAVNDLVWQVVQPALSERWRSFRNEYPALFLLWDDFLQRYPCSALAGRVREDLLKALLDVEYTIRLDCLRSESKARKGLALLDLIRERLSELGFTSTR